MATLSIPPLTKWIELRNGFVNMGGLREFFLEGLALGTRGADLKRVSEAPYCQLNRCTEVYRNSLCGKNPVEFWSSGRRHYATGFVNLPKI